MEEWQKQKTFVWSPEGLMACNRFYRFQKLSKWLYTRYDEDLAHEISSRFWRERYH